jgi:hypothetical protein
MAIICWNASFLDEADRERSLAPMYADTDEAEASNLREVITTIGNRSYSLIMRKGSQTGW